MSTLKTIALDAQKSGYLTHPYVNFIKSFRVKQQDKIIHTLSFREIEKIEKTKVPAHLERTKSGCSLGAGLVNVFRTYSPLPPIKFVRQKTKDFMLTFYNKKQAEKLPWG